MRFVIGFMFTLLVFIACTKIEQTTLGGDLIPVVDNISTFDTTMEVIANNYISLDSTRINAGFEHMAGGISNDPLFGTSKATFFFEFKPNVFPFYFEHPDTVRMFDSAVLILNYLGYYGDSAAPVQFNLYETAQKLQPDTTFKPQYTLTPGISINRGKLWGTKTMSANRYKDTIVIKRDTLIKGTVVNQLRIPLNQQLAEKLFYADSALAMGSDSLFKEFLPGFALEAQGAPGALHYFRINNNISGIEFYYRAKRGPSIDTISRNLIFNNRCGHAVEFMRNRSGAELNQFLTQNEATGVEQIYIQGTPGTMASIKIPGFGQLTNRILHRVELRIVELPEFSSATSQLSPPKAMYLDAVNPSKPGIYRGIPYDLNPYSGYYCYPPSGIDFSYFGGAPETIVVDGKQYNEYKFNITRYVQSVISRGEQVYNFRLSAPYYMYYPDCANNDGIFPIQVFPFQLGGSFINNIGESRVRLAGGNYPNPRLKMQVRIIYSKL